MRTRKRATIEMRTYILVESDGGGFEKLGSKVYENFNLARRKQSNQRCRWKQGAEDSPEHRSQLFLSFFCVHELFFELFLSFLFEFSGSSFFELVGSFCGCA